MAEAGEMADHRGRARRIVRGDGVVRMVLAGEAVQEDDRERFGKVLAQRGGVDVGRHDDVVHIVGHLRRRILAARPLQDRIVLVADRSKLAIVDDVQISDDVRTPIPVPDDTDA